jgi:hypothetical protein
MNVCSYIHYIQKLTHIMQYSIYEIVPRYHFREASTSSSVNQNSINVKEQVNGILLL